MSKAFELSEDYMKSWNDITDDQVSTCKKYISEVCRVPIDFLRVSVDSLEDLPIYFLKCLDARYENRYVCLTVSYKQQVGALVRHVVETSKNVEISQIQYPANQLSKSAAPITEKKGFLYMVCADGSERKLKWLYEISKKDGSLLVVPQKIRRNVKVDFANSKGFLWWPGEIILSGIAYKKLLKISEDSYGYWNVYSYLVSDTRVLDLNPFEDWFSFSCDFLSFWVQDGKLWGFRVHDHFIVCIDTEIVYEDGTFKCNPKPLLDDHIDSLSAKDGPFCIVEDIDSLFDVENFCVEIERI